MARLHVGVICALALAGCGEPFGVIPGGALDGEERPVPAVWGEVPEVIQLETRPEDPYSVNIWSVALGADLYVSTSAKHSAWLGHMSRDPHVRVRMNGELYPLLAFRVLDEDVRRQVGQAYAGKYKVDAGEAAKELIFRLDRREMAFGLNRP